MGSGWKIISKNHIVSIKKKYSYYLLERDISYLKMKFPFITVGKIGVSVCGRNLYYIKLGDGSNKVFYNGAHHALEWVTSLLLMKFTENICKAYKNGKRIRGYDITQLLKKSTIYIVPMVNPDGVELVINGLKKSHPYYSELLRWNDGSSDFSRVWQANARGVDLNHNYDASFDLSKKAEKEHCIVGPGPTRYSGEYPESEPETKALADFTRKEDFKLVMAYHSQGKEIYWQYGDATPPIARSIGEIFTEVSGYKLGEVTGIASYAGYKDWFIDKFKRPGYTIEVGWGKNPLPLTQFHQIYEDNEEMLILAGML